LIGDCLFTDTLQQRVADALCCPLLNGTWKLQLSALRALQPFVTRFVTSPMSADNVALPAFAAACHAVERLLLTIINTKNCSLSIVLTATDQKLQKSLKR